LQTKLFFLIIYHGPCHTNCHEFAQTLDFKDLKKKKFLWNFKYDFFFSWLCRTNEDF